MTFLNSYSFIILLCFLGFGLSAYLFAKQRNLKKKLVCPFNMKCEEVITSSYGKLFGIENTVLGMGYYLMTALGVWLILLEQNPHLDDLFLRGLWLLSFIGVLVSLYLIIVQWKILKKWCFWCLSASGITILIFLIETDLLIK